MAKMSLRGFYNLIESKTFSRLNVPADFIYNEIINELKRNNLTCSASIEPASYRFKQMESDGKVLFLSERGLFTLFVSICTVGNFSQVQIVTRNVARRYSFEDANHSMEFAMHNLYITAVKKSIINTIDSFANANNWSLIEGETNELENQ